MAILIPSAASAQQDQRLWQPTLDAARRTASTSGRLVLIFFHADWCQACRAMEQEVLSQPGVAEALQANFVAVRLNADHFPETAKKYGVTALPTSVIATPQGDAIDRVQGRVPGPQYVARLNQIAAQMGRPRGGAPTQLARAGTPTVPAGYGPAAPSAPPGQGFPAPSMVPADQVRPPLGAAPPTVIAAAPPSPPAAPAMAPPAAAPAPPPAGNPPLGLDGFCPVRLIEGQQWALGDRRWGVIHRDRTYLFSGPEEQRRFYADPDRYAPAASGTDVVLAAEYGQSVPGYRAHGVFYGSRVYLFAEEATLQRFSQNPAAYAGQAAQATRPDQPRR